MPNLLLQLMFAIGCDGTVVPNTKRWYQRLNFKIDQPTRSTSATATVYNVNKVIIFAMASALEVYFWTKRPSMSDCNLATYRILIDNSRRHAFHLKVLCTNILRLEVSKRKIDWNVQRRVAVDPKAVTMPMKNHLLEHYPFMVEMFGDLGCLDTNLGESAHKFVAKAAFEKSNKQYSAELAQMMNYVVKVEGKIKGSSILRQFTPNLLYYSMLLFALFQLATGTKRLYDEMQKMETQQSKAHHEQRSTTRPEGEADANKFTSTQGSKTQLLKWNSECRKYELQDQHLLFPYFHPCLSFEDVIKPFHAHGDMDRFKGRNLQLYLLSLLRVDSPSSEDPWYIRVDRSYKVGSRLKRRIHDCSSIYSAISLTSADGSMRLARVFAIVYIQWLKRSPKAEEEEKNNVEVSSLKLAYMNV